MIHDIRVSSFTDEYKPQPIIFFPSLFSQNNSSTGRRSGKVTKPPTSILEMLSSPRQTPRDLYPPLSHSTNFQRKKDIGSGHRLVHWRKECQTNWYVQRSNLMQSAADNYRHHQNQSQLCVVQQSQQHRRQTVHLAITDLKVLRHYFLPHTHSS